MFLKSLVSETVRKLAGKKFHAAGQEKKKARCPNLECSQAVMKPAVSEREGGNAGRLHNISQIMWA